MTNLSREGDLKVTQAEVQNLKKAGDQTSETGQELSEVHEQIGFHCNKIEYLEGHSRRNNIQINRIPEESGENWEKTKYAKDGSGNSTQAFL